MMSFSNRSCLGAGDSVVSVEGESVAACAVCVSCSCWRFLTWSFRFVGMGMGGN